ncbi:MAG TPA: DUF4212 domain-containing protein [Noviherbaspirillum sp.]|nr:DUF4212 domain-containing protein [Noviherbaspirillum sp.]
MPRNTEELAPPRKRYWQRARHITFVLLAIWFLATFGVIFYARELSRFTVFGWPFPFYMAAQGLTLLYVVIVAVYAIYMRRLDKILNSENPDGQ